MGSVSEITRPEYVVRASLFGGGCSIVRPSWLGRFFKWFSGVDKEALIAKVNKLAAQPITREKDARNLSQWTTALKVLHGDDEDAKNAIQRAEGCFTESRVATLSNEKMQKNIRERLVDQAARTLVDQFSHGVNVARTITTLQQEYGKLYPIASEDVNRAIDEAFHRAVCRIFLPNYDLMNPQRVEQAIEELNGLEAHWMSPAEARAIILELGAFYHRVFYRCQETFSDNTLDYGSKYALLKLAIAVQQASTRLAPRSDEVRAINEYHGGLIRAGWEKLYSLQLKTTSQDWASGAPTSYTSSKQLEGLGKLLGRIPDDIFRQLAVQKFECFQSVMNQPQSFQLSRVWALESRQKASFSQSYSHPRKKEMQEAFDGFPDSQAVARSFAPRDISGISVGGNRQKAIKEGAELSLSEELEETYQLFRRICAHCEELSCKEPSSMVGQMLTISAIDYQPVGVLKAYGSELLNWDETGNITMRSPASGIDRKFFFDTQRKVLVCEDARVLVQVDAQNRIVKEWEVARKVELAPDADIVKNGWTETITIRPCAN